MNEGLKQRYNLTKVNGEPVDPNGIYFVLRLDNGSSDKKHLSACRAAWAAYAKSLKDQKHLLYLCRDIVQQLERCPKCVGRLVPRNGTHFEHERRCVDCDCSYDFENYEQELNKMIDRNNE